MVDGRKEKTEKKKEAKKRNEMQIKRERCKTEHTRTIKELCETKKRCEFAENLLYF